MDSLSILTAAVSLVGGIAKAAFAINNFTRDFRAASKDLGAVSRELQALTTVLDGLSRTLSRFRPRTPRPALEPDDILRQINVPLEGCDAVITEITDMIARYSKQKTWTKVKWAAVGQGDVQKLRESLEAYKMALSLGLQSLIMYVSRLFLIDPMIITFLAKCPHFAAISSPPRKMKWTRFEIS